MTMAKVKVNFKLPAETAGNATSGILLGEFNEWDYNKGVSLKKEKDGSMTASLSLEAGASYQYRYLLNDGRWVNDGNADSYIHISEFQVENCIVKVEAAKPAKKATTKKETTKKVVAKTTTDDLTKIEGVGKKIASLLSSGGYGTFELLSKAKLADLKKILEEAGPRYNIHDPKTWAKQAKLAAAGKMDELKKLQDELKGGK